MDRLIVTLRQKREKARHTQLILAVSCASDIDAPCLIPKQALYFCFESKFGVEWSKAVCDA